ncbi:MAG TPA: hypothetical protein VIX35_07790 [Vicinamibacterales bacterium]
MDDRPRADQDDGLSIVMPPNARLSAMEFHDAERELRVSFADGGERTVLGARIESLQGAQVRSKLVPMDDAVPTRMFRPFAPMRPPSEAIEEFSYVFAMRVTGVGELWYALADSFNFRAALGPEGGYSTEGHLRALMRRIIALAPQAARDDFVMALIGNVALPPPVDSVYEFFKTAAKGL